MVVAEGGKLICGHGGEVLMAVDNDGKTIREFQQPDKRFAYALAQGRSLPLEQLAPGDPLARCVRLEGPDPRGPSLDGARPHRHDFAPARADAFRRVQFSNGSAAIGSRSSDSRPSRSTYRRTASIRRRRPLRSARGLRWTRKPSGSSTTRPPTRCCGPSIASRSPCPRSRSASSPE